VDRRSGEGGQGAIRLLYSEEELLFKAFGYLWQEEGLIGSWLPGVWAVTDSRLLFWRKAEGEVILDATLAELAAERLPSSGGGRPEMELAYAGGRVRISLADMAELERALEQAGARCKAGRAEGELAPVFL